MIESELREIYANAPVEKSTLEVLSMSAPWFSKTHYFQNQVVEGVTVTLEDGVTEVEVPWVPLQNTRSSNEGDLNYSQDLVLQQVNDIIASEYDNWTPGLSKPIFQIRLYVIYRDGSVSSIKEGPINAYVQDVNFSDEDSAAITITTTPTNRTATGERATLARIPMQAGFL